MRILRRTTTEQQTRKKKTIVFTLEEAEDETAASVINASYTEDLAAGTITVTVDGTSFVCEFDSETFTQID
ncbi:MAG: hypothetical protein NC041_03150 [Bacteroides sp.]|nr:hypothetical protein [Prevotella sp.]MCM1408393.1 hypothetical protein [Treponema brennaborense]MCM1469445.1 hypothetical protein [Bacteroides sp.]